MDELLTDNELAARLKVAVSTVRKWSREGRIPTFWLSSTIRRFELREVLAALDPKEPEVRR